MGRTCYIWDIGGLGVITKKCKPPQPLIYFPLFSYHSHLSFIKQQIDLTSAGCSGQYNLPVQIHNQRTTRYQGKKSFIAPDVHSLANQLMLEIPTLTLAYANVLATDAFYIEENMEITYTFAITKGTAELDTFKIVSTTLGGNKINVAWYIVKAKATFTAQRNVKIQRNRRRRRWIGGGRRRCTWKKLPRGVTAKEIEKIQSTLHSSMRRINTKSPFFVKERVINMKKKVSQGSCPAWNRVIKLSIVRGCSKRVGPVPKAFVRSAVGGPKHKIHIRTRPFGRKTVEP